MKLFVTGGTGFLGAHLLRVAIAAGYQITALRRHESRTRIKLTIEEESAIQWVEGGIDSFDPSLLKGVDVLVHLASAGVSPQQISWKDAFKLNVEATLSLIEAAADRNVGKLIVCGSIAEYGSTVSRYENIPPDAPLEPVGAYATSKASASMACLALARERNLALAVLRVSNMYGEGQHASNFWAQLYSAAINDRDFPMTAGEQVRDFIPVEEAAKVFVKACSRLKMTPGHPRVIHVTSGKQTTLLEFAESEWRRLSAKGNLLAGVIPYRKDEAKRCVPAVTPW